MPTEAQKRATKSWKGRRNLKRVELLLPEDILDRVDVAAAAVGISRTRFIVEATQQALGDDRLSRIEAKLDDLLSASKSEPPAEYITDHIPVYTKPKDRGPDPLLVAIAREHRPKGWVAVADALNDRGITTPTGNPWTNRSIAEYSGRHGIGG